MKRKMLVGLVIVVAAAMALFVNIDLKADSDQSLINLANIEALAGEPGEEEEIGGGQTCWESITYAEAHQVFYCGTCSWLPDRKQTLFSGKSSCN